MDAINTCAQFLSGALNNKSKALAQQTLPVFLTKFSDLIRISNFQLKIKVNPLGKHCLHCGKYIPKEKLATAVSL